MKKFLLASLVIAFASGAAVALFVASFPFFRDSGYYAESISPLFSPVSEDTLVSLIDSSKYSVDVMLYQFSNSRLRAALVEAAARNVQVRLILEPKVDSNLDTGVFLASRGISVRWASQKFYNTHAKFAVFDGKCVFVGSTNWSRAAFESNREASVSICSSRIVSEFEKVFESDWAIATAVTS